MALTPRLDLRQTQRQTQSLVMTPQLQQAIKLLQLSNLELMAYVEAELEQNPLLERAEPGESVSAEVDPQAPAASDGDAEDRSGSDSDTVSLEEAALAEAGPEIVASDDSWADGAEDAGAGEPSPFAVWGPGGRTDFEPTGPDIEQTPNRELSLRDHLLGQLNVDLLDPVDRVIGVHLVDMLDESGYLAGETAIVAGVLNCEVARVEATLEKLQRLDPPGIFARNLAECLALQLRERDRLDPAMQALLDNLDLLARRNLDALGRICGVDREDLNEMIAEIRSLDPKPGLAFDVVEVPPVTPDVIMRPRSGSGWIVELNTETLPRVLVNGTYYTTVSRQARSRKEKEYISTCFHAANWLVKSLHQRATTILRVATEIVRQQEPFFTLGVQHLRPLILRDIAAAIDMHESTVSRVTTNKYIETPRGIYELKYFFTSAIPSANGSTAHSAESVRHRIKALIDNEGPQGVLSDDRIVEILRADGVDIARRTVAKYREAMRIPSSIQRRREKAAGL